MYEFRLTPAYCLFNGAAILEQHGAEIIFMVENLNDVVLQGRLKRAFCAYLKGIEERDDCPEFFKREAKIDFIGGTREQLRRCVSLLYKAAADKCQISCIEEKSQKEAAAVLLLDNILHEAKEKCATDIHIEKNNIRFRISGALEKQMEIQKEHFDELIQRIKMLAGMNVLEKRRSQDGRFVYGKTNPIFVRASQMWVIGQNQEGEESMVLRILDTSRIPLSLNLLGFNEEQVEKIKQLENLRNGLILVCGPTGSGKSTTIASMLVDLEQRTKGRLKIISLEDPPEYVIPGISQIQIDEKYGNSFDQVLSHIFRQDPDVIMIGEIRDETSAAVAVRAALTGHLVFATLHTSGAGEAILRMENLGTDKRILVSVLKGVIAQELSFSAGKASLCADIALPGKNISAVVKDSFSEEEIDERFIHCTNYSEILSKALALFGNQSEEVLYRRSNFDWSVAENDTDISSKIG